MRGLFAALSVAAACLCAPANAFAQDSVYDPWEGLNRRLFATHEVLDKAVLEPAARGYRAVTNEPVRQGVSNFLRNLRSPVIFANDLLQGEFARAGTTAARFGLNTTIGLLGVMDAAEDVGLERHDEDFGQTLAVWGVEEGPYIFVPLLGPTNLRDGAARIVDMGIDPLTHAEFDGDDGFRVTRSVTSGVAARENLIETVDGIRANSPDAYVTYRSSYALLRESAVRNGRTDVQDLPEFEEIPEEPDADAPDQAPAPEAPGAQTPQEPSTPAEKIDAEHLAVEDVGTM